MADPKAVHASEFYIKTTSTAPSGSDALVWVRTLSVDVVRNVNNETYLADEWAKATITSGSFSGTMEVDVEAAGTIHELFVDYGPLGTTNAGAVLYLSVYDNPSAGAGIRKGWQFPIKIESMPHEFVATDVVRFTVNFVGYGPPVEVLGV